MMAPVSRATTNRRAYVNARFIDPSQAIDDVGGVIIEDGWILAAGRNVTAQSAGAGTAIVDCRGLMLIPGLVDMRVFTGEPGTEYR